jgi:hypothetical protein
MIRLNRSGKPVELTDEIKDSLTQEFKLTGKSVWNQDYIKKALLSYSNDKCCYCEANIKEESKYLEVEHFHHKEDYKDEVLEWENLLPSCKKCNGTKSNHDTMSEPIIKPTDVDPRLHLQYWCYRIKGIDDLGKMTVSVLNLNDQDRLVKKRFEIGNAIQEKVEQLNELMDDYLAGIQTGTRRRNRIVNGLKDLMREGLPTAIYSATSASVILNDTAFKTLKFNITNANLWDSEFVDLESKLTDTALNITSP